MNVNVNGQVKTLSLVAENGIDWVRDFVGNWGGLNQFPQNADGEYTTDEETFAWWAAAIERQAANDAKKAELIEKYGYDAVESALEDCGSDDLEDFQNEIAAALDWLEEKEDWKEWDRQDA